MKIAKQVLWILAFTFAGELLHGFVPLPVPAGVWGLVLLLAALCSGRLRLAEVDTAGDFLLDTMSMMFIPAAVGIVNSLGALRPVLAPYLLIVVLSTLAVMSVTGLTAEAILSRKETPRSRLAENEEPRVENTVGLAGLEEKDE